MNEDSSWKQQVTVIGLSVFVLRAKHFVEKQYGGKTGDYLKTNNFEELK